MGFCDFQPLDQVFGKITVIETNRTITMLTFSVLPDKLRLGELLLCWSEPTTMQPNGFENGADLDVHWGNNIDAFTPMTPYLSPAAYFRPISYLTVQNESLPCLSME